MLRKESWWKKMVEKDAYGYPIEKEEEEEEGGVFDLFIKFIKAKVEQDRAKLGEKVEV